MYKNYIHYKYRGTQSYGHLGNTVTSLLWPLFYGWGNGHRFLYKKTHVNVVSYGHIYSPKQYNPL